MKRLIYVVPMKYLFTANPVGPMKPGATWRSYLKLTYKVSHYWGSDSLVWLRLTETSDDCDSADGSSVGAVSDADPDDEREHESSVTDDSCIVM